MFTLIYIVSIAALEILRKYLEENIKKGFIRKSKLSVEYPIFFIPKKNGKPRLNIDY